MCGNFHEPQKYSTVPEAITQPSRQLKQFLSTRPARSKLPESLWQAAVELARQHGFHAVAHPLLSDYTPAEATAGPVFRVDRHNQPNVRSSN